MRITTSMVQRNVLADLNTLSSKLAETQAKAASGKEITRPSDDPFGTGRGDGPALRRWAPTSSTSATSRTRRAGRTRPSPRWTRSRGYVNRAHDLLDRGRPPTPPTPTVAQGDRRRDRPDHPGRQGDGERHLRRQLRALGHRDRRRRRTSSAPTTPTRATRPASTRRSRRAARDRPRRDDDDQHGRPARSSATAARTRPTASCSTPLRDIADHLRADDGAALRGDRHDGAARASSNTLLERARAQRRADEPARGRGHAPGPDLERRADRAALEHRGRRHRARR